MAAGKQAPSLTQYACSDSKLEFGFPTADTLKHDIIAFEKRAGAGCALRLPSPIIPSMDHKIQKDYSPSSPLKILMTDVTQEGVGV